MNTDIKVEMLLDAYQTRVNELEKEVIYLRTIMKQSMQERVSMSNDINEKKQEQNQHQEKAQEQKLK